MSELAREPPPGSEGGAALARFVSVMKEEAGHGFIVLERHPAFIRAKPVRAP